MKTIHNNLISLRHIEEIPQELLDEDLKLKYPYPSMYRSYYNGNYNMCIQSNNDNSVADTFGNNWFSESGIWSNGKEL